MTYNPLIHIITSSRADYGLLYPLIKQMEKNEKFNTQVVATGSHFDKDRGYSLQEILSDQILPIQAPTFRNFLDTSFDIGENFFRTANKFTYLFGTHAPDAIIVLGDRYEILSICSIALLLKIPIIHISGGEQTTGAYDNQIRNAITKMASIHFPSIEPYAYRILQMGEDPDNIHVVGSLSIDNIVDICSKICGNDIIFSQPNNFILNYHPETYETLLTPKEQITNIFEAILDCQLSSFSCICTAPNVDNDGRDILDVIKEYCNKYDEFSFIPNMGREKYIFNLSRRDLLIGNSSSGIVEAQYFGLPVVNIGERQDGRYRTPNIFDCVNNKKVIKQKIKEALKYEDNGYNTIYGDGDTAQKIVKILEGYDFTKKEKLLKKKFCGFTGVNNV